MLYQHSTFRSDLLARTDENRRENDEFTQFYAFSRIIHLFYMHQTAEIKPSTVNEPNT